MDSNKLQVYSVICFVSQQAGLVPLSLRVQDRYTSRLFSVLVPRWWNELLSMSKKPSHWLSSDDSYRPTASWNTCLYLVLKNGCILSLVCNSVWMYLLNETLKHCLSLLIFFICCKCKYSFVEVRVNVEVFCNLIIVYNYLTWHSLPIALGVVGLMLTCVTWSPFSQNIQVGRVPRVNWP